MHTDMWALIALSKPDIHANWPCSRRFFAMGFALDPRHHADGKVGLVTPNQTIVLELATGEFHHVPA